MRWCAACWTETGLEPNRLELEITEGIILQNTEAVLDTLTRLDQLGVSIAMDDFGTGYSSLSYLTRFPVKKIKIDRSFIDTLGTSPQTSAIVSSIVGLGQSLHVTITAEGVETESQAEILRNGAATRCRASTTASPRRGLPTRPRPSRSTARWWLSNRIGRPAPDYRAAPMPNL